MFNRAWDIKFRGIRKLDLLDTRRAISDFLFIRDEPRPVDLAFVAASPTVSSLYPALDLYETGRTPKILISGNGQAINGQSEWSVYKELALDKGVKKADLLIEPRAKNTLENFVFGAQLIAETGTGWRDLRTIALCAKPFHMRRVLMTARRHFPESIEFVVLPSSDPNDLNAETWWRSEHGRKRVLEELGRISTYGLRGDIGDY